MDSDFSPVADGVFVRRHERLHLNTGLVVGEDACLVVDTCETLAQGIDLRTAIRRITDLPWVVVNTHGHHDHAFGNAAFTPCEIWGHPGCVTMLTRYGEVQREVFHRAAVQGSDLGLAAELADTPIVVPDRPVDAETTIDLGGRAVHLRHLGRGHTDNDLVVEVPGLAVFAGDLVEEGDPPAFADAFPLDWPDTVAGLLVLGDDVPVVPGHGAVVDRRFVAGQQSLLAAVSRIVRAAFTERAGPADAAGRLASDLDLPTGAAEAAAERAYRQLRGEPAYPTPADIRARLGLGPDSTRGRREG
ncbi:MAG TPA: MBL fold metallo-hydrolase [Egicoccus sp.]|nr:MBL fold metallo-hydrolase [Egicoccus sp.]HSK22559.1 MBL fold metallo-hydrolase [Egicoccus sp.]